MKTLKKVLALVLVVALTAGISISATMAYLQDEDSDVNVMTLGNVQIEQIEQERDANGKLVDFTQAKPLYPYVGEVAWNDNTININGHDYNMFGEKLKNAQDKIVTVKNTGISDAYVRTIIALEDPFTTSLIGVNVGGVCYTQSGWISVTINGVQYSVTAFTYDKALKPDETSLPSFLQVYLKNTATNEDVALLGDTYDILALSQAVQTQGFDDAATALNTAFGEFNETNVQNWFGGITVPNYSTTGSEMNDTLTVLPDGTDVTKKVTKIVYGKTADYPEIVNGGYETTTIDNATAYYVPDGSGSYEVYMLADGVIYAPVNSRNLFANMSNVTEIDTSNLDFSHVQDALGMFANCTELETLDTASWDVSNITNMQSIFYGCNNLKNIDVSNWDTSNVTNMRMVFFRCYALDNETLKGVENWDVSNVTNFYSMFKHARGLTSLDLSNWDTSSATNMSHLFANIGGLEYLDLSGFDTSKVTDMSWMFYDDSKLTTIVVGDGWTTAAVTTTTQPFYNNQALVGGNGTTWLNVCNMANPARPWESSAKLIYAIVDGGTANPGLLTYKTN